VKKLVITVGVLVIVAVAMVYFMRGRNANTARVDKLFAQWDRADSPGCSLGVSKNGVLVYERGYGMANLELGVPITPASVFPAASISKQFTAMSILLLAKRGQLSLDNEVQKYIPEWADHGSRITIRHLLTHTSGLRDAFTLQGLAPPHEDGGDPNEALLKILARRSQPFQLEGIAQPARVGQQVADREPAPVVGPFGDVLSHLVVQRELAALCEEHDTHGGELLGDRGHVKDGCRRDGDL